MARRIIAFVDVLGFKGLVERVKQAELVEIYRDLQQAAREETTRSVFPDDHRRFDSDAFYTDDEISHERVVNIVMASDSLVIYSTDDSFRAILAVGSAVRGLLLAGFREGLALRGALAIGELDEIDLDDSGVEEHGWTARFAGLVGIGLVRAYELEAQSCWSGVVVHSDLVDHLAGTVLGEASDGSVTALDHCCASRFLLETEVPVKTHSSDGEVEVAHERQWAVHWPFLASAQDWRITEEQVAASFTSFGRAPLDPGAETKRDETIAFMRRAEDDAELCMARLLKREEAD